ncbi:hypothetical protein COCNU_09G003620 [Cocos nucifera]|uniref:Uncharacterized protein n=1 Tax=Cocos nucifera TaxID=13894 RepID=A0A8K0IK96_COCNU|nr:hypothetical protein COCNU_09G003620 [Cocos nucifera]
MASPAPPPTQDAMLLFPDYLVDDARTPPSQTSQLHQVNVRLVVASGGGTPSPAIIDALPIPGIIILGPRLSFHLLLLLNCSATTSAATSPATASKSSSAASRSGFGRGWTQRCWLRSRWFRTSP